MAKHLSGEELALVAMKKEFSRLEKIAERAKAEADEYMSIGTEMLSINQEFVEIVKSKEVNESSLKKLNALKKRSDKAEKIQKKDFIKLIDKQSDAEINRDRLAYEIQRIEFRQSLRKTG